MARTKKRSTSLHSRQEGVLSESTYGDVLLRGNPLTILSRHRHPTLDDQFFSIDDFNRITEEQEAGKASLGKLGSSKGEDDDDDDIRLDDDIGDLLGEDVLEGEEGEAGKCNVSRDANYSVPTKAFPQI